MRNPISKADASGLSCGTGNRTSSEELDIVSEYLRAAITRAITIRNQAPAGSHMETVLSRTIDGLELELSQLRYLTAAPDHVPGRAITDPRPAQTATRMRKAF